MIRDDDLDRSLAVYLGRSVSRGAGEWRLEDVVAPAGLRLYGATMTEIYLLGEHDERIPVEIGS